MNKKSKAAMCAATLGLAVVPATALGASTTPVKVRIEGPRRTLLAAETVRVHGGSVTRYGAPSGACPARSMAGALDVATRHRWRGTFNKSYGDFLVTSILGVTESGTKAFWATFANHRFASAGVCQSAARSGDSFVFAVLPATDYSGYLIGVTAPRVARVGVPATVKVVSYDATGRPHALSGARVTGRGIGAATTDREGRARVTPTRAGTLVLTATHAGFTKSKQHYDYVRGESAGVTVSR